MTCAPPISLALAALVLTLACGETPTETVDGSPEAQYARGSKKPKPPPTNNAPIDVAYPAGAIAAGYRIYGDVLDGSGTYVDGACGIDAEILSSSQDAWMDPDAEWNARLGCDRRFIKFDYSCEVGQTCTPGTNVEASGARMTIGALGNVTSETDVWAFFVPEFCTSGILFDPAEDAVTTYARAKLVSEPGASHRRWEVWASPGSDVAVCRASRKGRKQTPPVYYRLPFFLVITEE